MGSGELTASMVEVHKRLLRELPGAPQAVFLDTPAGFQLNVDQISSKAVEYFATRVGHAMGVASYKSHADASDFDRRQAGQVLRGADFILIGPGSPTYAVRQWQPSPVPDLLTRCVTAGGCLVAASAAALTMGRFTLPVYEIYKVGQELHWVAGLDLLGRFGINLVVVPHWNNAEGGTHDTRFCFMGAERFDALTALLPAPLPILGLDEHTACILDLAADAAEVKGLGGITLRTREGTLSFQSGERFALTVLREGIGAHTGAAAPAAPQSAPLEENGSDGFWQRAHALGSRFQTGLDRGEATTATRALLEFDRMVWQAQLGQESEEVVAQARDTLRDMMVLLGNALEAPFKLREEDLAPMVEILLELRGRLREEKQWEAADRLREALQAVNIQVEDTPSGHRWRLSSP
ncbi:MAG: hypothetical protein QNJ22_00680 [Desulfosarcinaceae bacterium]|nr:hypothetical protein [Desulfosarcinaceae bacterium]